MSIVINFKERAEQIRKRRKDKEKNSDQASTLDEAVEKNTKNNERLKKERKQANNSVMKSYRLKR